MEVFEMNALGVLWMEVEVALNYNFSDAQREDLNHILHERLGGNISFSETIGRIRKRMDAWGVLYKKPELVPKMLLSRSTGERLEAVKDSGTRARALSVMLAHYASKDEEVQRFRKDALNNVLLEQDRVESWIEDQVMADKGAGRSSTWLGMVPVPPGHDIRREPNTAFLDPPVTIEVLPPSITFSIKVLKYAAPESRWVRSVPVAIGGVLEKLQALSERLAKDYRWQPAQATLFILTGATPLISTLRIEVDSKLQTGLFGGMPSTGLSRVVLAIDPMTPPSKVKAHYERIRQKIVGKKHREMRERQIKLAAFTILSPEQEPWPERMDVWNNIVPDDWRYQSTSNFKRDAERAVERLLTPFSFDALLTSLNE